MAFRRTVAACPELMFPAFSDRPTNRSAATAWDLSEIGKRLPGKAKTESRRLFLLAAVSFIARTTSLACAVASVVQGNSSAAAVAVGLVAS